MPNITGAPREISLTQGLVALVDEDDYPALASVRWNALTTGSTPYALGRINGKITMMHREILKAPADMFVDHINMDGLDNRRCNLRLATKSQNMRNKGPRADNKTGLKGAWWDKKSRIWRAKIEVDKRRIFLGSFTSPEAAHAAYCAAAEKYHGEFARTA